MGKYAVPRALISVGAEVHVLDDYFDPTTPDDVWLTHAGQRGWIVITKDYNIRRHRLALSAIIRNHVKMFVFADANQTGEEMAATIIRAFPRIHRLSKNHPPPFIGRVTKSGAISLIPLRQR